MASGAPRRRRRRIDIQGMRTVAILGVVLYHAHLGFVPGGFTGVDDFFVISGFLITGLLWRELAAQRRIRFSSFYGRRMQRLLPMAFLVIAVTAIASAHWQAPLEARASMKDGISAALYVSNYRFALLQTNYLTSSLPPSPYQQFWSLGVEEQFYLVWPLLLLGASLIWRQRRAPSRVGAGLALGLLAVVSFIGCVWLTHANQPWAFFSLPTRAWELAVGGLVALAVPWFERLDQRISAALGWAGLVTVLGAVFFLPSSTPYPGTAALLPVLGTAAVIASGCGRPRWGPARLLSGTFMQVTGAISYSWYLWHWPILVLVPLALGHALTTAENLGLVVGSYFLSVVSYVALENPVRTWRWLRSRARRELQLGGALTAAGVATCLVAGALLPSLAGQGLAPVAAIRHPGAVRPSSDKGGSSTVTTASPVQASLDSATAQVQAEVVRSVGVQDVPANLTPSLADADADEPQVFVDGCLDSFLTDDVLPCDFGDTSSPTTVVLFGDSHAAMWFPAVDDSATALHWNLLNLTKATCPPVLNLPIYSPELGRTFVECTDWIQNVLARIAQAHPALVVLGVARHYSATYGFTVYGSQWLQGLAQMVTTIRQMGAQVAVMGPIPKPAFTVPACLSQHLTSATACTMPLRQAVNLSGMAAERAAVLSAGGSYIETLPWFCTATTCAAIVDNLDIFRDDNHITDTYSNFLAPVIQPELQLAMKG